MFWGCFAASGTGYLESVQGAMKCQDYQGIEGGNVMSSVRKLGFSCRLWILPQGNDQKHVTFRNNVDYSDLSSALNPVEHLWNELKYLGKESFKRDTTGAVCPQSPKYLSYRRGYKSHLIEVSSSKDCVGKYQVTAIVIFIQSCFISFLRVFNDSVKTQRLIFIS